MTRFIGIVAVGVVAAGVGYAVGDGDAGKWFADRGADFVKAAARGTEPQPPARDREAAVQALAARPDPSQAKSAGGLQARQTGGPITAILPAERGAAMPRPVGPRIAQVGVGTPGGEGDTANAETGSRRLAKAIQTELRRVGCYQGAIDGDWDGATRKAMKAFNDRVNASLPVRQPDYILLTLVQGHAAKACGAACPAGQAATDNGSCQPLSVLAEKRRAPSRQTNADETSRWAAIAAGAATAVSGANRRGPTESSSAGSGVGSEADARRLPSASPPGLRPAETRTREERDLIAAAEARKRQHAAELRAGAEAERAARIAEVERAWTVAEARRRSELAALAQRQSGVLQSQDTPGPAGSSARIVALAELPPATERIGSHILTRPADARFVGRFLPPPTYRVGRLPPSPDPRLRAPVVRVEGYRAARQPTRLRAIFKSVERNSP